MSYATTGDLVASRSDTASSTAETTTSAITSVDLYRIGSFVLDVTATSGSGTFTLDVAVQGYIAAYAWTDVGRFSQVTATGQRFLRGVGGTVGTGSTTVEEAAQSLDMTVGTIRPGPLGTQIRAIYTLVITGTLTVTWTVKYGLHS
jgi:hypothetical protein